MSPERSFLQRASITCLLLLLGQPLAGQPGGTWTEAPAFVRLFAPPPPRATAYRAYISPLDLPTILAARAFTARERPLLHPPGAWEARPLVAAEAFGQSGNYDRWRLARLYGARRPLVARGPSREGGQVREAWTLISPYPDAELQTLQPGTLLIVLRLP